MGFLPSVPYFMITPTVPIMETNEHAGLSQGTEPRSSGAVDIEAQLRGRGFSREDFEFFVGLIAADNDGEARCQAGELLHRIFLRVADDSAWGAALVLALGLERGASLARMASAHGVSRQYLHDIRNQLKAHLGDGLTVLTRQAPPATTPPPNVDEQSGESAGDDERATESCDDMAEGDLAPLRADAINPDDDDNEPDE